MASERIRIEIGKSGRVVLPKKLRERLHLHEGTELEVEELEDKILLKPVQKRAEIINKGGWLVARTGTPLSKDSILETIQKMREERDKKNAGLL